MPQIDGPRGPIPFERDGWGYPSVRARDRLDAAFAHGWLIATDRLIQVHLLRIAAEGRLLGAVGDKKVYRALDRSVRMFDLSGDAGDEVGHMSDEMRAVVEAWCAGFNQVARRRHRGLVLRAVGEPVRPVTPADVVAMYRMACFFGLTSLQLTAEVGITELLARGCDPSIVQLLLGDAAGGVDPESVAGADLTALGWFGIPAVGGSNAAAVAAHRSSTGGALLWGQPHMEIGRFPPVLYALHIELEDGGTLSGLNVPGLPWLTYGRTAQVAWAYTYGHGDNVDVLIERCSDGHYEADGVSKPLSRRDEHVRIKGGGEETWTFWDSPYGTVLGDATREGRYPCVRWSGLRRAGSDFNVILPIERATTAAELMEIHRGLHTLSLHALFADADGTIGYTQTGRIDQRPAGWDGAGPATGWTRADRTPEPLPESSRPWVLDPPDGLLLSANERVDGPDGSRWATMPEPRWRVERLHQTLGAVEHISPEALGEAMYDGHDRSAEVLLAVWQPLLDDPDFQALCAWGGVVDHPARDRHLGRFHALHDELLRGLLEPRIGAESTHTFLDELHLSLMFQWHLDKVLALDEPDLLDAAALGALLRDAWPRSAARAEAHAADVPPTATFVNAYFEGKLPGFLGLDSAPVTLPGGPVSPFQARRTGFQGETFLFGPATNFVVDFSQPGARYNLPGGASERRFGPGYGAGVDAWLEGELRPLGVPVPPVGASAGSRGDHLVRIDDGMYNVRGSFRVAKVIDIGTQCSLVRLHSGGFALLDAYRPTDEVWEQILALTDHGRAIEAVLNLHPFHTIHVRAVAELLPHARLYGTRRHVDKAPDLPWQPEHTEDPELHARFADDLTFMVPRGVDFVSDDDKVHFSSVLAFHPASKTLHVDDTLTYTRLPIVGGLVFHPTLAKALQPRPGAAAEFRTWALELAERCASVEHLCTAHGRPLPPDSSVGSPLAARIHQALERVEKVLAAHERRFPAPQASP